MKIRFVQLESDAFLTDIDFMRFSPAERGVYLSLILFLNSNGGKCPFDTSAMSRLCNCESPEEFEKIWNTVAKKFQTHNGVIKHKRVTKELAMARKHRQAKRAAGLKGAEKRWQSDGTANGNAIAKERKGNVIEKESEDHSNSNTTEHALSSSTSVRTLYTAESQRRALDFNEALTGIIRPRTQSDRTCFHNVTKWLVESCAAGRFNDAIFGRVLDYAKEAREGGANPAAVFMALLKKELGYRNG